MRKFLLAFFISLLLAPLTSAHAAEIKALITTAMKAAIDELAPQFERASGHTLRITYGPSGALAKRLNDGESADLIILAVTGLDELARSGKVSVQRTTIARTGIGVAVRKGAPKPNISSPDAFKRALLAARSVAYVAPESGGITGAHIVKMFEKLGIAKEIDAKKKLAAGGPDGRVSTIVANGDAEIGLQQISELMSNPGVDVVGTLPASLQQITVYAASVTTSAKETAAAKALIRHLSTREAGSIFASKGLNAK